MLFIPMFIFTLLAITPLLIWYFANGATWYVTYSDLYWFGVSVYFLMIWNVLFYSIMMYLLNTLIITDKRVLENQQITFFNHTLNEFELTRIQDVSVSVVGIFATFLNYGDINVQTAGTVTKFNFLRFPNPKQIKQIILENV